MIKVYPSGACIKAKIGNVEGMITAVCMRFAFVNYEITYFVNGEYKTVWMNENEFTTDAKRKSIGFNQ